MSRNQRYIWRGAGAGGVVEHYVRVEIVEGVQLEGRNPVEYRITNTVWRDVEVSGEATGIEISRE